MISKDVFITYAQFHEDIIIAALLHNVDKGFYVDVGANHEEYHSVTKYFYERGWHGINIEPIPRLVAEFKKKRKRDINLQLAVAAKSGHLTLRDYPEYDGLSTLSETSKHEADKENLPHKDYEVEVDSLKNIFTKNHVTKIDFLKIDVEGYEAEVLKSNDWETYRPTVLCVEANHRSNDWSKFVSDKNYTCVVADGLNEYYLANESLSLFDGFAERAALFVHNGVRNHHIQMWNADLERIKFLEDLTSRQDALIKSTQQALEAAKLHAAKVEKNSMTGKPYRIRAKIAAKGLTINYYREKKSGR